MPVRIYRRKRIGKRRGHYHRKENTTSSVLETQCSKALCAHIELRYSFMSTPRCLASSLSHRS
jgi:hypothetical protein